ncbi:ATP-dependent RNA helicase DDX19/DBP5 [Nematocida sp. AWRm80]|nr:ATP-dependent RNA helicase DDX19/DBP5 [Nematocida sp. AWRm80]
MQEDRIEKSKGVSGAQDSKNDSIEVPPQLKAAMDMLSQMEFSKRENEDQEEYKKTLLTSELIAECSFEDLKIPESIISALKGMEFKNPSIIQQKSIPEMEKRIDVAFQSHSGSGKTIAFIIGALMTVNLSVKEAQVIIMSPTRDLAKQIFEVLERFKEKVKFTSRLSVKELVRQATDSEPITEQIVVGTPGTLKNAIQHRMNPSTIKAVILDEADQILTETLGTQTISLLKRIPKKQLILFSATFNDQMKAAIKMVSKEIKTFYLESNDVKPANITQFYIETSETDKPKVLLELYSLIPVGQSIIFVESKHKTEKVLKILAEDGFDADVMHGDTSVDERDRILKKFKDGEIKALVTTNLLSRGIDVPQVNLAVNYDIPRDGNRNLDIETYIHRIGRTGRFNRVGVSVTLVKDQTEIKELYQLQRFIKEPIKLVTLDSLKEAIQKKQEIEETKPNSTD